MRLLRKVLDLIIQKISKARVLAVATTSPCSTDKCVCQQGKSQFIIIKPWCQFFSPWEAKFLICCASSFLPLLFSSIFSFGLSLFFFFSFRRSTFLDRSSTSVERSFRCRCHCCQALDLIFLNLLPNDATF